MLALERMGVDLELYSVYPPPTSFRHGHAAKLKAQVQYAPPAAILKLAETDAMKAGRWPAKFIADQEQKYGRAYKPELRARNALYFADLFAARGITHFHVHFANRAAHTALFIKHLSGIPFSLSTHGQDFMVDLGSDDLLREICREAEFVANETEYSKGLVAGICPESSAKMLRVFNGMDLTNFPAPTAATCNPIVRIVSIGRLIEFKGFHHLISACSKLRWRKLAFSCDIIGEGPWRERLQSQIEELNLVDCVRLTGALPQEEVFSSLRTCDIFALACTTDRDGATDVFPTVILEAMASAKPVVSTRLAGVPEQVIDDKTGYLVEPDDVDALAEALDRLITSPDRRRMFGQEGRARIESHFAVEQTVKPLYEEFEKRVKQDSSSPSSVAGGLGVLLSEWPPSGTVEAEVDQLAVQDSGARFYAFDAGRRAPSATARRILARCDFLPDGMIVEGEWQQERELARRIETLRTGLGQKLSSALFLRHARQALWLRQWIAHRGICHVHATGGMELLTAWLLKQLCKITISATLEDENALPESILALLAEDCAGVRLPAKKEKILSALANSSGPPFVLAQKWKLSRKVAPEWIAKLLAWSRAESESAS